MFDFPLAELERLSPAEAAREYEKFKSDVRASLPVTYSYYVGVDLGQRRDSTIITNVQIESRKAGEETIAVSDIRVIKKGVSYVLQAASIACYCGAQCFDTWPTRVSVDASGVGLPVSDLLNSEHGVKHQRVVITSGEGRSGNNCSRNWLIRNVEKWISKPNFYFSSDVPEVQRLRDELLALSLEWSKFGNVSYTSETHDDAVMSLALALSALERSRSVRSGTTNIWLDR